VLPVLAHRGVSTEYGQYLVTTVKVHKNEGYTQRVLNVSNPKVCVRSILGIEFQTSSKEQFRIPLWNQFFVVATTKRL
jgi:hypothetical protein